MSVTAPSGGAVTADFGDRPADSIGGIVFNDRNENRLQDAGEPGIPGVTVTLIDPDGNEVKSTVTDADGSYTFTGVLPGNYTVKESNLPVYKSTTDDEVPVTLVSGASLTTNFGDRQENRLNGLVFNDVNGDRIQGDGEPGIPGVDIKLMDTGGNVLATVITGGDGTYKFEYLDAATYIVQETDPTNYISTTDNTVTAVVPPGGAGRADFGDHQVSVITGKVFNDINGDEVQTYSKPGGEPGIAGATVTLFDSSGNVLSTAIANPDGSYLFNVSPGTYTLKETDPAGYISTTDNMKLVSVAPGGAGIANFGDRRVGTVSGIVYHDVNGDKVQSITESGISGVNIVLLDSSGKEVNTKATDAYGVYVFENVSPGTYTVKETDPDGWLSSTANELPVTVPSGGVGTANFGDYEIATIGGTVWDDVNGNLSQDAGEQGICGVVVTLTDSSGAATVAVTDADGIYLFENIVPGTYTVRETDPAAFVSTTGNEVSVTVPENGAGFANFGDRQINTISGRVFNDANGDRTVSPNEKGLFNVKIELLGADGITVIATTYTDADGTYNFNNVAPGNYTVRETDPGAYTSTTPNDVAVSMSPGGTATADFGDRETGSINGTVYNDIDSSGTKGAGESGIGAVTVQLFTGAGTTPIATAVTDVSGRYSFHNLVPGSYRVEETDPAGYASTTDNELTVSVTADQPGIADFGDLQGIKISGKVFNDANANKTQGDDEESISGVTVTLFDKDGNEVATTETTITGYVFENLRPGTYTVEETDPDLYNSTTENEITLTLSPGVSGTADFGDRLENSISGKVFDDKDGNKVQDAGEQGLAGVTVTLLDRNGDEVKSTVTDAEGNYIFEKLGLGNYSVKETDPSGADFSWGSTTPNEVSVTVGLDQPGKADFGDRQLGGIAGTVFDDKDGNKAQDAGEQGIADVTVTLLDAGGNVIKTTLTGADGKYSFADVPPGTYTVKESDPATYSSTTDNEVSVSVTPDKAGVADFGDRQESSIAGIVFNDKDGDKAQGAGEEGIPGVTVTLLDADGNEIKTVVTDAEGKYSFENIPVGDYTVKESDPSAYVSTTDNEIPVTLTSDKAETADFGDRQLGGIAGTVFNDKDGDKAQGAGEQGIAGVTITLLDADGKEVKTAVTDAEGKYNFADITPGDYTVKESDPTGYVSTSDNEVTVTVTPEQPGVADFGDRQESSIAGAVFNDKDGDKLQGAGEQGIPGVTLTLLDPDGNEIKTLVTDADGKYSFEDIPVGDYTVKETDPTDYISTTDNEVPITLTPDKAATVSFGDRQTAALLVNVFYDTNGDRFRDLEEKGISGVAVTLLDADGKTVATVQTDAEGNYRFENLAPGDYTVKETDLNGYTSTTANQFTLTLAAGKTETAEFGDRQVGRITGTVFNDTDASMKKDAGEAGISGVTVILTDSSGKVIGTVVTDTDGNYVFEDMKPGDYTVTESDPDGYSSTSSNEVSVILLPGSAGVADFGDQQQGVITGIVFNDINGDGNRGPGENPLGNVTVELSDGKGNKIGVMTTDDNGVYLFENLVTGIYTVKETDPQGFSSTTDNAVKVILPPGGAGTVNFGDHEIAGISGTVYNDVNGNRMPDAGEKGIGNVPVELLDSSGNVIESAVTDSSGNYAFRNLEPGDYRVQVTDPAGYTPTTDSEVPVSVGPGSTGIANFGEQRKTGFSGTVFTDVDGDRLQGAEEYGIAGVLVYADVNRNGVHDANEPSAMTDSLGKYSVGGLGPGEYQAALDPATVPKGLEQTLAPETVRLEDGGAPYTRADFGYQPREVNLTEISKKVTDLNGGNLVPGDILLYEIILRNMGQYDAEGIELEDPIPEHTVFMQDSIAAPADSEVVSETPVIRITGIKVPAFGQVSIRFRVKLSPDVPADVKEISNQATVRYDSDSDGINDTTADTDGNTSQDGTQPTVIPITRGPNFEDSEKTVVHKYDMDFNAAVSPGDVLEYKIVLRNTGDADAKDVFFHDAVPEHTSYVQDTVSVLSRASETGTALFNASRNRIEWIGDVPVRGTVAISFDVTVNDGVVRYTVIENQGFVAYDSDGDGENDATEATDADPDDPGNQPAETIVGGSEDAAIKTVTDVNGGNAEPGDELLYVITLTNKTDTAAEGIELTDSIPAYTAYMPGSLSYPAGCTAVSETPVIRVQGITIPAKAQTAVIFRVKIANPLPAGVTEISNQALMNYHHGNPVIPDRVWQTDGDLVQPGQNPTVIPLTSGPNFTKTSKTVAIQTDADGDGAVSALDTLRYKVVISNTGTADVSGAEFTDEIPEHTAYIQGSLIADSGTAVYKASDSGEPGASGTGHIEWKGDVAKGQGVTLYFDVTVPILSSGGIAFGTLISNQGTVSYDTDKDGKNDASVPTDSETSAPGYQPADVSAGKPPWGIVFKYMEPVNGGDVKPGDEILCKILLKNQGGTDALGMEFTDVIPAHTFYVPASLTVPEGCTVVTEDPVIRVKDIDIHGHQEKTITFRVLVENPIPEGVTEIRNQGTVTFDSNADGINDSRQWTDADSSDPGEQPTSVPIRREPEKGDIAGTVFTDSNTDGIQGEYEGTIGGATLELLDKEGKVLFITVSDASGEYSFTNLAPGDYTVRETDIFGFLSSTPNEVAVTVPAGEIAYADFGDYVERGSITGKVFEDLNFNEVQDAGEPGIPGVTVKLTGADGLSLTTLTDADGLYRFRDLPPGNYTVSETDPDSYVSTTDNAVPVTLTGTQGQTIAFGDAAQSDFVGRITGTVFNDVNTDGIRDDNEGTIGGTTLELLDSSGAVFDITVSDAQGRYSFDDLPPGDYTVRETNISGFVSSTPDEVAVKIAGPETEIADFGDYTAGTVRGTVFNDVNKDGVQNAGETGIPNVAVELLDSDGNVIDETTSNPDGSYTFGNVVPGDYTVRESDPDGFTSTTPNSVPVTVPEGSAGVVNFGDHTAGAVTGIVFNDLNKDGIQNPGEDGIPNVRVELFDADGNLADVTTTDADGNYSFDSVTPGSYTVRETNPSGFSSTTPDSVPVTVPEGGGGVLNFGDRKIGTVTGIVFNDVNGDGVKSAGEDGIPAVKVELLDSNGKVIATTATNPDGAYSFENVAPGTYTVRESDPTGYGSTTPNAESVTVPEDGSGMVSFGDRTVGTVTGVVFNDVNGDGVQNPGEDGIPNVKVELLGPDGKVIGETATNADGAYGFKNVAPGSYTVRESDPDGFTSTTPNTVPVTVPENGSGIANFGDHTVGTVTGVVFNDVNGDGVRNPGEDGIPNVKVELLGPDGKVIGETA
ncbi:MAG: hypothetical protein BWK80_27000, partial [Desulfobacteraceae bacterium IS3]